jgi:hypothetical protein
VFLLCQPLTFSIFRPNFRCCAGSNLGCSCSLAESSLSPLAIAVHSRPLDPPILLALIPRATTPREERHVCVCVAVSRPFFSQERPWAVSLEARSGCWAAFSPSAVLCWARACVLQTGWQTSWAQMRLLQRPSGASKRYPRPPRRVWWRWSADS